MAIAEKERCPTASQLEALHLGRLADWEAEQLARHLDQCTACSAELEQLHSVDPLLRALSTPPGNEPYLHEAPLAKLYCDLLTQMKSADTLAHREAATMVDTGTTAADPFRTAALVRPPREFGRYRIVQPLGEGGMGVVYRAYDTTLEREVALKIPKLDSERSRQRFVREAKAAAALNHPGICQIYDIGEVDGHWYLTMELVAGPPLSRYLAQRGPLPTPEITRLCREMAAALAHAHAAGVMHRDFKPANVLLDNNEKPRVTDFGLAKRIERDPTISSDGQMLGTPAYMPPEQVLGELDRIGPPADVYSFGMILYEMLAGRRPFDGPAPLLFQQILTSQPAPPSSHRQDVDPQLEAICLRALAKSPSERFANASDLLEALSACSQQTEPDGQTAIPPSARTGMPKQALWFAAVALAVVAVALSWQYFFPPDKNPGIAAAATMQGAASVERKEDVPARTPTSEHSSDEPTRAVAAVEEDVADHLTEAAVNGSVDELGAQAVAILERYCHECHGQNGANEGGLNYILAVERLTERKKLVPGDPEASRLLRRIVSGEMPPDGTALRPSAEEVAVLRNWIRAGAPPPKSSRVEERPHLDQASEMQAVHQHLVSLDQRDRPFQRYFSFRHLHNLSNRSAADLALYRAALAKLVNSLSWQASIYNPHVVNPEQTLLAIDLRELDWDRNALWLEILKPYPYGLKFDSIGDNPALREQSRAVYEMTGTDLPIVRADWFIATAARPPLYHRLLDIPATAVELETRLRVDVRQNFLRNRVHRAGFATSGVSSQNRLVERHDSAYGAYWKSYDFKSNEGQANLFLFPLGPLFNGHPLPQHAFQHDGGEIIFHLPNGLQGYMLVDGNDRRIDEGPIEVVHDKLKTSGTPAVVNGVSCMACHARGLIVDFSDTVLHGTAVGGEALEKVRRLFPESEVLARAMQEDNERFSRALDKALAPFVGNGLSAADSSEPIGPIARWYRLQDLSAEELAAELGMPDVQRLRSAIENNPRLRELGLGPVIKGGSIKRTAWESIENVFSPFQEASRELRVGTPIVLARGDK